MYHQRAFEDILSSLLYYTICFLFRLATNIFFREILKRGSHQIPKHGPIIFVSAPHANQFVDPLVIMQTCPRPLRFLMAASSMRKGVPGFFGHLLRCIPVERPMDLAKDGIGKIFCRERGSLVIHGIGTKFTKHIIARKSSIAIGSPPGAYSFVVEQVKSDMLLLLRKPLDDAAYDLLGKEEGVPFEILPVIDQSDVYNAVFDVLERGECIGIFPEGGSHDRAEMLPLKAGVTIMALGMMARNPSVDVTIVPCGLNYFNPDKFRSRAIVEYGDPLKIDHKLVELFKAGGDFRREACGRLLDQIYYSLCSVTVNVPDFETLQLMQAARRLYQPQSRKLSTFELLEVTRRIIKGYLTFKDQPRIRKLMDAILEYNKVLKHLQLYDHQVSTLQLTPLRAATRFVSQILILLLYAITILPGLLLNLPAMIIIDQISRRKAERAVARSTVKLKGRDVLATWKLMVGFVLFPFMYLIYCFPLAYQLYVYGRTSLARVLGICMVASGIVLPWISYITIRVAEHGFETYLSIRPLWYSVTRPHYGEVIRDLRNRLKLELIKVVDEFGPKLMADFNTSRIVPSRRVSVDVNGGSSNGQYVATGKTPVSFPLSNSLPEQDEDGSLTDLVEKAKSISRESSPVLGFDGLDTVISRFEYMRAGVHAALSTSKLTDEELSTIPDRQDWSYVDPVEIDDIFFTQATQSPRSMKRKND